MTESIKIIQQALEGIPGGPYENLEIRVYFESFQWIGLVYRDLW
ncbi:hypothetical protein CASFOL_007791 [Castilleja foliolosa]|uniref:Uncharacterized protein n=1 Tax=Castilleja foliolosa TaxID=1961234 RepID=A0ABD3E3N1_9LAMI